MGRIYSEEERKDMARYTKRLMFNPHTEKQYWEIVKDGKEVVGTAAFSLFKDYNKGDE
tara:strand:- start:588 stop:761 length:174 start_codon:yes stop_codon:yes gene_type:complete